MTNISSIKEINGISHFENFVWDAKSSEKYNLIYGWNGTGKTTLSRILRFYEKGEIDLEEFEDLEMKINTDGGIVSKGDIPDNNLQIRVFNEDFVEENLSFRESEAKPIVILGKDNVETEREIEKLEEEINNQEEDKKRIKREIDGIPDTGDMLTECGREVTGEFAGTPLASGKYDRRSYDKRNVEGLIDDIGITKDNVESFIKEKNKLQYLREKVTSKKNEIEKPEISVKGIEGDFRDGNKLLTKEIETESINRLEEDEKLREWVSEGYKMHRERGGSKCLFCSNELPDNLLAEYGRFFTQEVNKAEEELSEVISDVDEIEDSLATTLPDSSLFFADLADAYSVQREKVEEAIERIKSACAELKTRLERRVGRMHVDDTVGEEVSLPADAITTAKNGLETIGNLCQRHNDRVDSADEEAMEAARQIEIHTVASHLSKKDYFEHLAKTRRLTREAEKIDDELSEKRDLINEKRAELRNTAIAVERINKIIADFLGEGEIEMGIQSSEGSEEGYYVKRDGEETKYLSDGEKSIVALAYFLVSLNEEKCNIEESTVVVDDPVDSQDTMYLFQAFGLLKRRLKNAGQLFILTHNYDFFNLVRDWMTSSRYEDKSRLFTLEMNSSNGKKEAVLSNAPNLLKNHKTEYQYLFYKLYMYKEGEVSIEEPLLPNVARKVLEHFSSFKWSCKTAESLGNIVHSRFIKSDNERKSGVGDAVLKFVHEYSHGGSFERRITDSVMQADKICNNVLEFIYWADKSHYESLENEIESK